MDANKREFDSLVRAIIGAAYEVGNILGCGFLEKLYERALVQELALRGLKVQTQVPFPVTYKGRRVGDYCADLLVDGKIIVELKCADRLGNLHMAQCINYLKASGVKIALLINFQRPKIEWKRIVYRF
jgi:GxxExxY protein